MLWCKVIFISVFLIAIAILVRNLIITYPMARDAVLSWHFAEMRIMRRNIESMERLRKSPTTLCLVEMISSDGIVSNVHVAGCSR